MWLYEHNMSLESSLKRREKEYLHLWLKLIGLNTTNSNLRLIV
jgi:hypothetical protein